MYYALGQGLCNTIKHTVRDLYQTFKYPLERMIAGNGWITEQDGSVTHNLGTSFLNTDSDCAVKAIFRPGSLPDRSHE